MNEIKKTTCRIGTLFIKSLVVISLVFSFGFGAAIKAYAAESSESNLLRNTTDSKSVSEYPLNPLNEDLSESSTANGGSPYNPFKNPLVEIINALYKNTFAKKYDTIAKNLLDGLFGFFGLGGDTSYDAVDPVLEKLDLMQKNLKSIQSEFQESANKLSFQQSASKFQEVVNPINVLLLGSTGDGGEIGLIKQEVINNKNLVNAGSNDNATLKIYEDNLQQISQIDGYDCTSGNAGELNSRWEDLWSLCTDATQLPGVPTNLESLYQNCLKASDDRDQAITNFQGFYQSWISTCLVTNYVMTISNSARIEQIQLVLDHWDTFKDSDDKWQGAYRQAWESRIADDGSINKGCLIYRAETLSKERRAIIDKITEFNLLVLQTPCYNLTNTATGASQNYHSFSDLWVKAQEVNSDSYAITLNSDVVCNLKKGQQTIYGVTLSSDEDMTTNLIKHNTDVDKATYFKNNNLKVVSGSSLQLNLNGHSIANINNNNPSIYLENGASLSVDGRPTNAKSNTTSQILSDAHNAKSKQTNNETEQIDDQIGQIDAISCDAGSNLNLNYIVFDNIVDKRSYVLPEDSPQSETYPTIEIQINCFDKNIPQSYVYATDNCNVKVEECCFNMTNTANIPADSGSAINMDSDKTKKNSSSLSVNKSLFKDLVSRASNGAAIKTQGSLNAEECEFIGCSSTEKGGAVAHLDEYQYTLNNKEMNPITFTTCKFDGNSSAKSGGAIYNEGYVEFSNCTLQNNTASLCGGAVEESGIKYDSWQWSGEQCQVTDYLDGKIGFTNTVFDSNAAQDGGAIHADCGIKGSGKDSKFVLNSALGNGGAINFGSTDRWPDEHKFDLTCCIEDATITNNTAGVDGGALYNADTHIKDIKFDGTSQINNNTAGSNYGGIYSKSDISLFSDSTVTGNVSNGFCAGLYAGGSLNLADKVIVRENYSQKMRTDMDACINNEGMYIEKTLQPGSDVKLCVKNTDCHWVTDDKTDQSTPKPDGNKWSKRLENSKQYFWVTNTWGQNNITAVINKGLSRDKHITGFRDAYYLHW